MAYVIQNAPQMKRKLRNPRHTWNLQHRPWQIQPFLIAPVLPGETLKNLTYQARAVTDPIINPIMGWWLEHSFFYVKLRDMYNRDLFTKMVLDPVADLSALDSGTDRAYYHVNGTGLAINWPKNCLATIVENYFRYEGELSTTATLNGLPTAGVQINSALDSATIAADYEGAQANIMDDNLVSTTPGQGDGTAAVYTSEIDKAHREYQYARLMNVTDMTFEDYCASFGLSLPKEARDEPELIRRISEWQYPSNTIDPANGAPRSAVSWSCQGRADKDRLFKEPGFIVGITVCRPKVYFKNLTSHMTILMRDAFSWLPPQLAADANASFVKVASGDAPIDNASSDYYVDIKDIFVHGDQWLNFDAANLPTGVVSPNLVNLPSADLSNKRYPASTDADALFVNNTAGVAGLRQDGVCELSILGRQEDTSPQKIGVRRLPVL